MPDALEVHRRLLERWRQAMDLVGPGPLGPHYDDCRQAVQDLPVQGQWADLGSGAGFPGFILAALFPDATVRLVERRQKRATFLETAVAEAKLKNAAVHCGDTAAEPTGFFDGIISRAYKPPPDILPEAERLLKPGGLLVLMLAADPPATAPANLRFWGDSQRRGSWRHGLYIWRLISTTKIMFRNRYD